MKFHIDIEIGDEALAQGLASYLAEQTQRLAERERTYRERNDPTKLVEVLAPLLPQILAIFKKGTGPIVVPHPDEDPITQIANEMLGFLTNFDKSKLRGDEPFTVEDEKKIVAGFEPIFDKYRYQNVVVTAWWLRSMLLTMLPRVLFLDLMDTDDRVRLSPEEFTGLQNDRFDDLTELLMTVLDNAGMLPGFKDEPDFEDKPSADSRQPSAEQASESTDEPTNEPPADEPSPA